jgi:hypothetical protein
VSVARLAANIAYDQKIAGVTGTTAEVVNYFTFLLRILAVVEPALACFSNCLPLLARYLYRWSRTPVGQSLERFLSRVIPSSKKASPEPTPDYLVTTIGSARTRPVELKNAYHMNWTETNGLDEEAEVSLVDSGIRSEFTRTTSKTS